MLNLSYSARPGTSKPPTALMSEGCGEEVALDRRSTVVSDDPPRGSVNSSVAVRMRSMRHRDFITLCRSVVLFHRRSRALRVRRMRRLTLASGQSNYRTRLDARLRRHHGSSTCGVCRKARAELPRVIFRLQKKRQGGVMGILWRLAVIRASNAPAVTVLISKGLQETSTRRPGLAGSR